MPAKAGILSRLGGIDFMNLFWIPACAGMTGKRIATRPRCRNNVRLIISNITIPTDFTR
jgi:hypothetical protein